jgi:hypothetical protein
MSQYLQILQQVIFWVLALYGTLVLPLCPFLLRDAFKEVGKGDAGWSERICTFGIISGKGLIVIDFRQTASSKLF